MIHGTKLYLSLIVQPLKPHYCSRFGCPSAVKIEGMKICDHFELPTLVISLPLLLTKLSHLTYSILYYVALFTAVYFEQISRLYDLQLKAKASEI